MPDVALAVPCQPCAVATAELVAFAEIALFEKVEFEILIMPSLFITPPCAIVFASLEVALAFITLKSSVLIAVALDSALISELIFEKVESSIVPIAPSLSLFITPP